MSVFSQERRSELREAANLSTSLLMQRIEVAVRGMRRNPSPLTVQQAARLVDADVSGAAGLKRVRAALEQMVKEGRAKKEVITKGLRHKSFTGKAFGGKGVRSQKSARYSIPSR